MSLLKPSMYYHITCPACGHELSVPDMGDLVREILVMSETPVMARVPQYRACDGCGLMVKYTLHEARANVCKVPGLWTVVGIVLGILMALVSCVSENGPGSFGVTMGSVLSGSNLIMASIWLALGAVGGMVWDWSERSEAKRFNRIMDELHPIDTTITGG